jgi:hypothetical protein
MAGGAGEEFTCRRARAGAITVVIGALIAIETTALHLLLWNLAPLIAGSLTVMSLAVLAWLVADYRAMGREAFRVHPGEIDLRIGRRLSAVIPRTTIASAIAPSRRDIPQPGGDYLNATKPAAPNILLTLNAPVRVRAVGGLKRSVKRIGLCVDEPERLLAALGELGNRED